MSAEPQASVPLQNGADPPRERYDWSTPRRTLHPLGKNPGDAWAIAIQSNSADNNSTFPIDLPRRCIAASTRPGDLVLDPFAGSSPTGRAALESGRRYLGIDINPEEHDAAAVTLTATTQEQPC